MKRAQTMPILLVAGVFLLPLLASAAIPDDHPYKSITTRNAFSLLPPPAPAPAEPPKPPANIKLTGITTLRGDKRALLMVQDTSGPGKTDQSVILREGQRDGDVEVLKIDDKAGTVKIKNGGNEATLTFDQNGVKLPTMPVPSPVGLPQPPNVLSAPSRTGTGPSPTMTAIGQPPPHNSLRQIPTRQLRLPTGRQPEDASIPQQILMETSRAANPDHPPLPPTDVGDLLGTSPPTIPNE